MSSKAIEPSGRDYLTLANLITEAKLEVDDARIGLNHLLPVDPVEEKRIDELARREYDLQSAVPNAVPNFNGIRAEISARESKVEIANEGKRKALKDAVAKLEQEVEKFRSALQVDLSNGYAVEALERIDRFAAGNVDQAAVMMIGMARQLQDARKVRQSSSVRSGAPAQRQGFNPTRDY